MQKTSAPLATTCWGLERDGQAHLCGDGEFRPMGARAEQDDYTQVTHARDQLWIRAMIAINGLKINAM